MILNIWYEYCPTCHKIKPVRKNGFTSTDKQLFQCKECGRNFILDPLKRGRPRSTLFIFCPVCNKIQNVGSRKKAIDGTSRFQCYICRCYFMEGKPYRKQDLTRIKFCPRCNSDQYITISDINYRNKNIIRYRCKTCKYKFTDGQPYHCVYRYPPQVIDNVKDYFTKYPEISPLYVSNKFNVSYGYTNKIKQETRLKNPI